MQAVQTGARTMDRDTDYNDWDVVVIACEKEFTLINNTRISMDIAEQCQKVTYKLALEERAKYPKPEQEEEEKENI